MPVSITTTKEQRIAKLVAAMKEAGLRPTQINVEVDTFGAPIVGGYIERLSGCRTVRANIELVATSDEAHELLRAWMLGQYEYER